VFVLLDLRIRKNKCRCMKSTVLCTLPHCTGKDPDPYQSVGCGSVLDSKAGSGSVSKGSGSATLVKTI
jgi:hypothetical protein